MILSSFPQVHVQESLWTKLQVKLQVSWYSLKEKCCNLSALLLYRQTSHTRIDRWVHLPTSWHKAGYRAYQVTWGQPGMWIPHTLPAGAWGLVQQHSARWRLWISPTLTHGDQQHFHSGESKPWTSPVLKLTNLPFTCGNRVWKSSIQQAYIHPVKRMQKWMGAYSVSWNQECKWKFVPLSMACQF